MANLIHCNNEYICIEGLVEFLLSLSYLLYLIMSYRIISHDKSGVLVQIDRYLCFAALIQIFLQTNYFLYFDNDFILTTIRCMGIALQIMICNILGSIVGDEEQQPKVWQLARTLLIGTFILWFWAGIIHKSAIDYNCVQVDYLILSSLGLFLAFGSFYIGNLALEGLTEYKNKLDIARSSNIQIQQHVQKYEQVLIRMKQITLMHYCGLLQFGVQFAFDIFTYMNCDNSRECTNYYNASSIFSVLYLIIYKLIQFATLPATIFWIFYEMNKLKFQEEERNTIEMNITQ